MHEVGRARHWLKWLLESPFHGSKVMFTYIPAIAYVSLGLPTIFYGSLHHFLVPTHAR